MQFTLAAVFTALSISTNVLAVKVDRFTEVTRVSEVFRQKPVHGNSNENEPVAYLQTFTDDNCRGSGAQHYVILEDQINQCREIEPEKHRWAESAELVFLNSDYEVSVFPKSNCRGDPVEVPEPEEKDSCEPADNNKVRSWKSFLVAEKRE